MAKDYQNEVNRLQEDTQKVINKWEKILLSESAPKLAREDMGVVARLIDEQHKWVEEEYQRLGKNLQESAINTTAGIEPFLKILVPTLRRAYKSMNVLDLVGIQPMNAPSGYVYALRFHYAGDKDNAINGPGDTEYNMGGSYTSMSYVLVFPRAGALKRSDDTTTATLSTSTTCMTAGKSGVGKVLIKSSAINKTGSDVTIGADDILGYIAYAEQDSTYMKVVINRTYKADGTTLADLPNTSTYMASNYVTFTNTAVGATSVTLADCYSITINSFFDNEIGYRFILKNYTKVAGASTPYTSSASTQSGEGMETWNTAAANRTPFYKTIKITMERAPVYCESRKLKLQYSDELYQDLKAVHGMLANEELMRIAEFEVANEINSSLLEEIYAVATFAGTWKYGATVGISQTYQVKDDGTKVAGYTSSDYADGMYEKQKFQTLATKIRDEANKIALTTRRGSGNWVIVTPSVLTALQALDFIPAAATAGDTLTSGLSFVGMLQNLKVYVDTYNYFGTNFACIGYKGTTQYDAGIIYAPYVALQVKKAVDPDSLQDVYGFLSRDAVIKNLYGAENYYRMLTIDLAGSAIG